MQIHELTTRRRVKKKPRIGRGGKRGTYSGKGMKGQKSRSGGNVDPLFEGGRTSLIDRMKKNRGFSSVRGKALNFSLSEISKHFSDGETVSFSSLRAKGLIQKSNRQKSVKILASGTMEKKLVFQGDIQVSGAAKLAIEKTGGKVHFEKKKTEEVKEDK